MATTAAAAEAIIIVLLAERVPCFGDAERVWCAPLTGVAADLALG